MRQLRLDFLFCPADRYPAVAVCAACFARLGAVGGDINRHGTLEIDEVTVAMEKLDLARATAEGVFDRIAVEQTAYHSQIFAKFF